LKRERVAQEEKKRKREEEEEEEARTWVLHVKFM